MPGKKHSSHSYRGFRSKAQWRWAFATKKSFARRWAHETPGGPKVRYRRLPRRVGRGGRRRRR
jgi:hypothetical protein